VSLKNVENSQEHTMSYQIIDVTFENEFKVCPSCGYKDAFHSMLVQNRFYEKTGERDVPEAAYQALSYWITVSSFRGALATRNLKISPYGRNDMGGRQTVNRN
jgi:hypothetical protein